MDYSEAFFYCMLLLVGLVFLFLFIIHSIDDKTGHNKHYNNSYKSHNKYRSSYNDWEDNDFDGFHDNDDTAWNEDKY